jgi:hypothetical protein
MVHKQIVNNGSNFTKAGIQYSALRTVHVTTSAHGASLVVLGHPFAASSQLVLAGSQLVLADSQLVLEGSLLDYDLQVGKLQGNNQGLLWGNQELVDAMYSAKNQLVGNWG